MFRIAFIIPTGVGAEIGGYAGDASVVVRLLAQVADEVLTHPNTVNAAGFYTAPDNVLYVEGYYLDRFFEGQIGLRRIGSNNIGLIIDRRCEPYLSMIENAVNATCLTAGIRLAGYLLTDTPLDIQFYKSDYGHHGSVKNTAPLLNATRHAVSMGATALAVLTYMDLLEKQEEQAYMNGGAIDPIGATEALISHFLASELGVPVAHSPIFKPHLTLETLDPRVAAEEIGTTYLPCILMGLSRAPQIVEPQQTDFHITDIQAVVAPADCIGSIPMLTAIDRQIPLILVEENTTSLNVQAEMLNLENSSIYSVSNYLEACGLLIALKYGIAPETLCRPYHSTFTRMSHQFHMSGCMKNG